MSLEGIQLSHYRLINMIGSGSMGEVYLAEDVRISRQIALKIVKVEPYFYPNQESVKEAHRGLQREIRAIANLTNMHIIPIYDFGTEIINKTEITYIVMPYFPEGSLKQWVQQRSSSEPLSPLEVALIINQAAEALQNAHENNIIHQDIKPLNFLVRTRKDFPNSPDLFLADFGIAKFTTATLTTGQSVRGTPAYMPPEQWESNPVPATDQYALAIMAYELLTKRLPFQGRMEQVMRQLYTTQPVAPSTFNTQITTALDAVILRALEKKPEERFPSISDFANAFQRAITYTDLRSTLVLSANEAMIGINRTMKLPGLRQTIIAVPPGTYNGQILYLQGEGEPFYDDGPRGPLVLTVVIDENRRTTRPIAPTSDFVNQPSNVAIENITLQSPITPTYSPIYPSASPPIISKQHMNSIKSSFTNKKSSTVKIVLLLLIILLIGVSSIFGFMSYQNNIFQQAEATATVVTAINNPYPRYLPGLGAIKLVDPLTMHTQWSEDTDSTTRKDCIYNRSTFQVSAPDQHHFSICNSDSDEYNNFAFEVQMMIIKGDCGGITFRYNPHRQFYMFKVCQSPIGSDATLLNYKDPGGVLLIILAPDKPVSLNQSNQWNTLTIFAKGSDINLYINKQLVGNIKDGSYTRGAIGLIAYDITNTTTVAYRDAKIWTLK